jgi:formylglycine-generating enzyme required for sulfatase activity
MKIKSILTIAATAALITSASASVTIDYVSVGNAGNAADSTGYGAVAYAYQIGKYEVTNAQYGAFLNAKGASNSGAIYNSSMTGTGITQTGSSGNFSYSVTSGFENKPVVYVSWFDAARFTNWLHNGQGTGSMETGAYNLVDATTGIISVNPGAKAWIPTEDEWYKAAYYSAANTSYSLYPNGQNTITSADANYSFGVGSTTDVGSYSGDGSSYGTFDQGGNVWEWNDAVISGSSRGLRGGSFYNFGSSLRSSGRYNSAPSFELDGGVGFRVASVPEPTSLLSLAGLLGGGLSLRRRSKNPL